ncbi:MAG: hypothetical protein OEQ39_03030 [Gammaproteobacteria bacterium]|nr:hypothetical protein [Gammaproteobacteria bacterium]MDH3375924.1 hypothetical protein [Gammaproteobacteria bacterium]
MRKSRKLMFAAGVAALGMAGSVFAQYTPRSTEGGTLSQNLSVYSDDFYWAGYIANAAVTNLGGLAVLKGGKFSEVADHSEWLVSVTDGDSDGLETITVSDNGGSGWLEIKTNNKAADDVEIQKNGEAFAVTSTRDLWFETKIAIDDVDQDNVVVGLTVADTDVLGSLGNDFMLFHFNQNTNVFKWAKNGTIETNTAVTTWTDSGATVGGNAKTLSFFVDGSESDIFVYVDNVLIASNKGSTNVPNDEALSPVYGIRTIDTGADSLWIDYLEIRQTR